MFFILCFLHKNKVLFCLFVFFTPSNQQLILADCAKIQLSKTQTRCFFIFCCGLSFSGHKVNSSTSWTTADQFENINRETLRINLCSVKIMTRIKQILAFATLEIEWGVINVTYLVNIVCDCLSKFPFLPKIFPFLQLTWNHTQLDFFNFCFLSVLT